tara:strand:+ start:7217 stop:8224 length:1008 start_codon:yes stop_codon:yes gene_type:complete
MKKQLILFLISFITLLIGFLFFYYSTDNNLSAEDERNFRIKDISSIDKIFLVDKKGSKVLLTKENEMWMVNNKYIARDIRIKTLLKTAQNIKVKQRVPKEKKDRILKNLATNNIKVEFFSKGDLIKSYFIGSADGSTTGTYMLLIDEESGKNFSTPFLTHIIGFEGYLTPRYEPNPNTWRDLTIFFFPKNAIQSLKLEYPSDPENNFEIKLEKSDYALFQKNKKLNFKKNALKKYLLNFKSISAENILTGKVKETVLNKLKSQNIWFSLSITNFTGEKIKVKGYKKKLPNGSKNTIGSPLIFDPDRFYGFCFENELTTLQHYVFDPLLIKSTDLQ